jgi:hypothetical protein
MSQVINFPPFVNLCRTWREGKMDSWGRAGEWELLWAFVFDPQEEITATAGPSLERPGGSTSQSESCGSLVPSRLPLFDHSHNCHPFVRYRNHSFTLSIIWTVGRARSHKERQCVTQSLGGLSFDKRPPAGSKGDHLQNHQSPSPSKPQTKFCL